VGVFAVFPWELEFFNSIPVKMWKTEGCVTHGWSTDQLDHFQRSICTTYIKRLDMSISHKNFFFSQKRWLSFYLSLRLGCTSKIVVAFQAWVFVRVLHYITAQEGTSQDNFLLLKNMATTVWVRTNLYTPDCMMCPVALLDVSAPKASNSNGRP
jgi:hypothetical protein